MLSAAFRVTVNLKVLYMIKAKEGSHRGLGLLSLHSAKLPEYIPQVRSLGETDRIRSGHVMSTMGRFSRNVGTSIATAWEAVNNWGIIVYCQSM